MIQLSLRTGERREAYILARKLTAESDRMYDDMSRNLVSIPASDLAVSARAAWSGTAVAFTSSPPSPDTRSNAEPSIIQEYAPVPIITAAQQPDIYDPALMATVARLNEAKTRQQRKETGKNHVPETMAKLRRVTAKLFILITGVEDLRHVRQAHVSKFRDNLHQLPKSWGKGPNDGVMTWASVMAHAKTLPPAQVGLASGTINRHLDVLGQILARAKDDGIPLYP